jgi:hypothetical protein
MGLQKCSAKMLLGRSWRLAYVGDLKVFGLDAVAGMQQGCYKRYLWICDVLLQILQIEGLSCLSLKV